MFDSAPINAVRIKETTMPSVVRVIITYLQCLFQPAEGRNGIQFLLDLALNA